MEKINKLILDVNHLEITIRFICRLITDVLRKEGISDKYPDKKTFLKLYNNYYYHAIKKHKKHKKQIIIKINTPVKITRDKANLTLDIL